MAEATLLALGKSVVSKLADLVAQEISLACCAKEELRKLQDSLSNINDTLQAFEEGQYVRTSLTNKWLEKLKDVAYDAEDVLDEFATEVSRQRMEKICFGTLDEVREFSSRLLFNFKMGCQIKTIRERLDNITRDRNNFHPTIQPSFRTSVVNSETSSSSPNPSTVIGRDEDKDAIMQLLKELEPQTATDVPVISIVGMGGVGKTTLAGLVFNDEVEKYFNPRIWVCVSDDFDAKTIAKKVIECITKKNCDHSEMEVIQLSLRVNLDKKRYLLVLDDLWNDNHDKWVQLKDLLMGGKEGSKILVTTRNKDVASVMSTPSLHLLIGPLSNEVDCWSMFKQRAFHEGEEEKYKTTLVPIGEQIVRNCQGVPLAITALGSLLHSNTNKSYWEFVRDNEIWKLTEDVNRNERKSIKIIPILKLSYDHLPPHLKACFAYCSLFPKGCAIYRLTLINLWMANGLVQPSTRPMEDVANEYFHILLSRTFFQDAEKYHDGSIKCCKMHDIMHDLARSIAGTEYLIAGEDTEAPQGGDITPTPQGSARHLWLSGELNPQLFGLFSTEHKSRTLLNFGRTGLPYDKFLSLKRLRALDLSWSNLERLPDSICELKHLRYLDLCFSKIRALPDSFSKLQNLQTLIVLRCINLRELPKDMWKMVKLRHIINWGTLLTHMPSGLGQLSSLQTLELFVVGDKIGGRISELATLDGLKGELHIENLEHVIDPTDAAKASLEKKQNLNFLILKWDSEQIWTWRQQRDEHILGCLHPPTNLKELVIYGYAGVKFPYWRMSTLEHLVSIKLYNFSRCQHLSALGDLPSLQLLSLQNILHLECISGGFTSLEHLNLDGLPELQKWEGQLLSLRHLTTLEIRSCPSLVAMPFFPSLQKWILKYSRGELLVRLMTPNHTSSTLFGIPTLQSLEIAECDDLECLPAEGLKNLVYLEVLNIQRCSSLKSLSEDVLQHLSALRSLSINDCPMITSLPISPYITDLSIENCPNATWLEAEQSLLGFRSLQELCMESLPKVVSFPNALQHATSLQSLDIQYCDGLTSIPEWLTNLTSLQELVLRDCPLLTSPPEGMQRLTTLQNLEIRACPNLYRRCQRQTGEDWAKIAHVPNQDHSYVSSDLSDEEYVSSDLSDEDFSEISAV